MVQGSKKTFGGRIKENKSLVAIINWNIDSCFNDWNYLNVDGQISVDILERGHL